MSKMVTPPVKYGSKSFLEVCYALKWPKFPKKPETDQWSLWLTQSVTHCKGVDWYPANIAGLFKIPLAAITPAVQ